jgi:hypothetical protein
MDLFAAPSAPGVKAGLSEAAPETAAAAVPEPQTQESQPASEAEAAPAPAAKRLPPAPPLNVSELRKALHQILPLLTDQDPGAKDCLKDNRTTFRSAFSPEGYVEFEQFVKGSDFSQALEHLRKAAKRHGISV